MKAVRTEDHIYVEYKTGDHELYNLKRDPYELRNVYETAPRGLKRRLKAQLDALRQCSAGECRVAEGGAPQPASQPETTGPTEGG